MDIVFFSNFINHHQVLVADELYALTNKNYVFVETTGMPQSFINTGYPDFSNRPYVLKAWENESCYQKAKNLALSASVAVFGDSSLPFMVHRSKHTDKLSFELSERWLKKGVINLLSPLLIKTQWYYHTLFKKKPIYKLCCSAFAANDQYLLRSYLGRCYKWGYFTKVEHFDIKQSLKSRKNGQLKIMWCARMIEWKHPEIAIKLAARLREKNIDFALNMYGGGEKLASISRMIEDLSLQNHVTLKGNHPNDVILKEMKLHDIFLFTSDRNEGWGAVANEAMASCCLLVGSDEIGAVPYLIKDGENGIVYKSRDVDSLFNKIMTLVHNPIRLDNMAQAGYYTILNTWSPTNAANNLIKLIDNLQGRSSEEITYGPCSKAYPF